MKNNLPVFLLTLAVCCIISTTVFTQNYIGVWRSGSAHQMILPYGTTDTYFKNYKQAEQRGYANISNVEVNYKNGVYVCGVWEKPQRRTPASYFRVGTWSQIQSDIREAAQKNMYLKDIEVFYNPPDGEYFHAVFAYGSKRQELHKASGWNSFVRTWQNVSARNMRLTSVEYYNNKFYGVFEKGTQGYYLFNLTGWSAFTKKWEELGKKNYRLVDIETYISNSGKRHYVGVWLPGRDGYYLWNVQGYHNFAKKFNELKKAGGWKLVDLEIVY